MVDAVTIRTAVESFRYHHPIIARDRSDALRDIWEHAEEIADAINRMFEERPRMKYAYIVIHARLGSVTDYVIKISRDGTYRIFRAWRFTENMDYYRERLLAFDSGVEVY